MDEIVYVIADNEFGRWYTMGHGRFADIKKNGIYKGVMLADNLIINPYNAKPFQWTSTSSPFRVISKVEALVASRGDIKWVP